MVQISKQIYDRIIGLAIAGTLLSEKLRELQAQHPDEVDEDLVIAWSDIEELLLEHHNVAFKQGGKDDV